MNIGCLVQLVSPQIILIVKVRGDIYRERIKTRTLEDMEFLYKGTFYPTMYTDIFE